MFIHIDYSSVQIEIELFLLMPAFSAPIPQGTPEFSPSPSDTYAPPTRPQEDWGRWNHAKPDLTSITPLPVKLKAGDVIFVHHKVAHRIGLNTSPHIRYQVGTSEGGREARGMGLGFDKFHVFLLLSVSPGLFPSPHSRRRQEHHSFR